MTSAMHSCTLRLIILCVCTLVVCFKFTCSAKFNAKKICIIERLEMCERTENNILDLTPIRLDQPLNDNTRITMNATLHWDMDTDPRLEIDVKRCRSREALDQCDNFALLKPVETCRFIGFKNMAWSPFVSAFKPPIGCPIKKGFYEIKDGWFDPELFKIFPIDSFYWKITIIFYDKKNYTKLCTEAKIVGVRN